jgi:3'(2'), 5'-bisphosphate nucleotidase
MTDLAREVAVARQAAAEAGAIARGMQAGITSEAKGDGSPVTPGDLAADAVLKHHLGLHFPDDGILSEESDAAPGEPRRWWIIDPIDGTREYAAGGRELCEQVALAVDGVAVLGVLDLPVFGVQLWGIPGFGAWIADAAGIRPLSPASGGRNTLIGSGSRRNAESLAQIHGALPEFHLLHGHSVGVKVHRMLSGEADLYLHRRPIHAWDLAGPAAVLSAAGGIAADPRGEPLRFDHRRPTMDGLSFALRDDLPALLARL